MIINNLILFIIAGFFLILSGTHLVRSLSKIAAFLRISEFTAAFILMSLATCSPEFFVGISSALKGIPTIGLGNILGASIIDITLISGILILLSKKVRINSEKIEQDFYITLFAIFLVMGLYLIGNSLSRVDGIILLCHFSFNTYRLMKQKEKKKKIYTHPTPIKRHHAVAHSFVFIISIAILFISAKFAVKYAHLIALDLKLPEIFLGLFLLSFATTLPEFTFGIKAIAMHHKKLAIGDLTGGIFTNFTLILGIISIINPIQTSLNVFLISSFFLFFAVLMFIIFSKTKNRLETKEGIFLILFYVLFVVLGIFLR